MKQEMQMNVPTMYAISEVEKTYNQERLHSALGYRPLRWSSSAAYNPCERKGRA